MKRVSTKALCRAGIIAALYAVLTWPLGSFAYGAMGFQIRPAEALTMLPLFYAESVPALYVGCLLANLLSGYGAWDIGLGSLCTLIAALGTFGAGKLIRNTPLRIIVGGLFPVLINAFGIPVVMLLAGSTGAGYWFNFASLALTQAAWVYGLGVPLYLFVHGMRKKGVSAFCDNKSGERLQAPRPAEQSKR